MNFLSKSALVVLFSTIGVAQANVVGPGTQNFNTITSGLDFVTVQSSETLKPGVLNFGLFFNLAGNTLPQVDNGSTLISYENTLLGADFNLGLGLLERWDVGISFPFILSQSVSASSGIVGSFAENGNTEIRINTKYRFLGDDSKGIAAIFSTNINRTQNDPFTGIGAGPTFNLELAADTTIARWSLGVNIGHRWRDPGTPVSGPIDPFRNQWISSFAGSYLFEKIDTKLILEVYGSFASGSLNSNLKRSLASAEGLIGVKHDFNTNFAGHLGFAREFANALSSPDWRIYMGVNYALGPLWKDKPAPIKITSVPKRIVLREIYFEFDSAEIKEDSHEVLDDLGSQLKNLTFSLVTIEGHTDSVGSSDYNLNLSQARANSIRKYLIEQQNISGDKLHAVGKGEEYPIADNGNFQGRQLNRRVEFAIKN